MAIQTTFFNAISSDRLYESILFTTQLNMIASNGYVDGYQDSLNMYITPSNTLVTIEPGAYFIEGHWWMSNSDYLVSWINTSGVDEYFEIYIVLDRGARTLSVETREIQPLTQEPLTENSGIYEEQLATYTLKPDDTIADLVVTMGKSNVEGYVTTTVQDLLEAHENETLDGQPGTALKHMTGNQYKGLLDRDLELDNRLGNGAEFSGDYASDSDLVFLSAEAINLLITRYILGFTQLPLFTPFLTGPNTFTGKILPDSEDILYDDTISGASATNVQEAIDGLLNPVEAGVTALQLQNSRDISYLMSEEEIENRALDYTSKFYKTELEMRPGLTITRPWYNIFDWYNSYTPAVTIQRYSDRLRFDSGTSSIGVFNTLIFSVKIEELMAHKPIFKIRQYQESTYAPDTRLRIYDGKLEPSDWVPNEDRQPLGYKGFVILMDTLNTMTINEVDLYEEMSAYTFDSEYVTFSIQTFDTQSAYYNYLSIYEAFIDDVQIMSPKWMTVEDDSTARGFGYYGETDIEIYPEIRTSNNMELLEFNKQAPSDLSIGDTTIDVKSYDGEPTTFWSDGVQTKTVGATEDNTFVGRVFYGNVDFNTGAGTNHMIASFNNDTTQYMYNSDGRFDLVTSASNTLGYGGRLYGKNKFVFLLDGANNGKIVVNGEVLTLEDNTGDEFTISKLSLACRENGTLLAMEGSIKEFYISSTLINEQQAIDLTAGRENASELLSTAEIQYNSDSFSHNKSLAFDGSNDYMAFPSEVESLFNSGKSWSATSKYRIGFQTGTGHWSFSTTQASQHFLSFVNNAFVDTQTIRTTYFVDASGTNIEGTSPVKLAYGKKITLTTTCDGATIKLYCEGQLVASGPAYATGYGLNEFPDGLGRYNTNYRDVAHDYVMIHDKALSLEEVQEIHNTDEPVANENLKVYWDFRRGTRLDYSGNGNHGQEVSVSVDGTFIETANVKNLGTLTGEYDLTGTYASTTPDTRKNVLKVGDEVTVQDKSGYENVLISKVAPEQITIDALTNNYFVEDGVKVYQSSNGEITPEIPWDSITDMTITPQSDGWSVTSIGNTQAYVLDGTYTLDTDVDDAYYFTKSDITFAPSDTVILKTRLRVDSDNQGYSNSGGKSHQLYFGDGVRLVQLSVNTQYMSTQEGAVYVDFAHGDYQTDFHEFVVEKVGQSHVNFYVDDVLVRTTNYTLFATSTINYIRFGDYSTTSGAYQSVIVYDYIKYIKNYPQGYQGVIKTSDYFLRREVEANAINLATWLKYTGLSTSIQVALSQKNDGEDDSFVNSTMSAYNVDEYQSLDVDKLVSKSLQRLRYHISNPSPETEVPQIIRELGVTD